MNTTVQLFNNPQFGEVRVVRRENNEVFFVANDVAKILGYIYPANAIQDHVDEYDKIIVQLSDIQDVDKTPHLKGSRITIINESGVYSLVFGSKLDSAKQFKRWITAEVLPAIRRTGGYMMTRPEETPEEIMARALKVAEETLERHRQQNQMLMGENQSLNNEVRTLAPKAQYFDEVLQSTTTYTMTQVAKELGMSAAALERLLHQKGIIFKQSTTWLPYSKYQGMEYHKFRTHRYIKADGTNGSNTILVWTEKGKHFIHEVFNRKQNVNIR
jgi:prophage antirepressor-like protein